MAIDHKYFSIKGDFFIKERGSDAAPYFVGNAAAAQLSLAREVATLMSSGNVLGQLAEEETSRTVTLSVTLNSLLAKNLSMYFYGDIVAQAASTAQTATVPALKAGEMFKLPHVNVTNVELDGVPASSYRALAKGGAIVAIADFPTPVDPDEGFDITYDAGAASAIGIFQNSGKEYEITFISEKSGTVVVGYRWKPNPAQAFDLISTEFAAPVLEGPLLLEENANLDAALGQYGAIYSA